MNYFELFSIPISLNIDVAQLQKTYYRLCREFHPDHASADEQDQAMHQTADIHKAREVLSNPELRLAYILQIQDMMADDEKYKLPPSFLGRMMDINETAMEISSDEEKQQFMQEINALQQELFEPVAAYFTADELHLTPEKLTALELYYYQQKYVNRMLTTMNK